MAFDNFVAGRLSSLNATDMVTAKQKWISCFLGKPSAPFPSDFARPSANDPGVAPPPVTLDTYAKTAVELVTPRTTLASSRIVAREGSFITNSIPLLAILPLIGLVVYLLLCRIRRLWVMARPREWFLRHIDRRVLARRSGYVFRSLSWASILAAFSYLMHPRARLPNVCWFALPFGIAMTYLTYRFKVVPREECEKQEKREEG